MNGGDRSSRRGGFFERLALLNLGLLTALFMAAMTVRSEDFATAPRPWYDVLQIGTFLVWFPTNFLYVFGSMHLKFKNQWHDHGLLFFALLSGGVSLMFIIHA